MTLFCPKSPRDEYRDDRLLLAELVVQEPREARVRALGHARGVHGSVALLRVVVDEEVLGLDHRQSNRSYWTWF